MSVDSPGQQPARARRILLVDDDVAFTSFFKEFLLTYRPGAWIVHTADHYAPALACLKENAIDLAVLDIRMPIMDGLQLLTLLKRTHPELQLVILTSSATPEHRAQSLQNGAALFFDKTEIAGGLDKIYAALESVASAPPEGFRGMLRQVGLPEVLQMECLGRKSSVLEVTSPNASGRIFIHDGSIQHAEMGSAQGEAALFQLLGLSGGEFHLKPYSRPARQTIDANWESLVMEAARLHDEAAGEIVPPESDGPGPDAVKSTRAASSVAPRRRIQEIVLCSNTGELFYEWQSSAIESRIQLLQDILKISASLAKSLNQARPDRLEVESQDSRAVMLLQADRRVFVLSADPPPGS